MVAWRPQLEIQEAVQEAQEDLALPTGMVSFFYPAFHDLATLSLLPPPPLKPMIVSPDDCSQRSDGGGF